MSDDNTFRLMILIVGLIFMPLGLYHRIRSHTGEKLDRWQEGAFILFGLRLTALVFFVGGIAWMIDSQWMAWSSMPIPVWLRWVGLAVAVCAGIVWVWTVHTLDKNLTDTVVTRKDHSLVVSGPYRWVRHPFYTATFVGLVAGSVAMANWFFLVLGALGIGFLVARTRIEEGKLVERFGDEYRDYMKRTGRFVPRLKGRSE
jgi:protein-S-isoprenylcysteine O-methyltransferase Ste14